jgi:hypothetical protein
MIFWTFSINKNFIFCRKITKDAIDAGLSTALIASFMIFWTFSICKNFIFCRKITKNAIDAIFNHASIAFFIMFINT